jgi:hypothetical protein
MRLQKWLSRVLAAILLGSHGWLLATQWQAGRLTEPGLLLRWAAAIALALSMWALYRTGAALLSRKSIIIWLLAALLHGPAVVSRTGDIVTFNGLPETTVTLVLQSAALAGALTLATFLFAAVLRRRTLATPKAWSFIALLGDTTSLSDGFSAVVSARPPPART